MQETILYFLTVLIYFGVIIICHEFGHILYIKLVLRQKLDFGTDHKGVYFRIKQNTSALDKINIASWGVLFGYKCLMYFLIDDRYFILYSLAYFIGCKHDLKLIYKYTKVLYNG
jgi:hypothetical protein